jgi:modulator of drug activity B
MKNIFIINGHEYHEHAKGKYNATLVKTAKELFESNSYKVKTTVIQDGYDGDEEIKKFLWSDVVIFQFPKYWMSIPAAFKRYLDYGLSSAHGTLYAHDGRNDGGKYGEGGLAKDKNYMFSITMNAPKSAFNNVETFFEGRSVEDLFFPLHKAFQFLGFQPLKTFACHDVMGKPDIQRDKSRYIEHLQKQIIVPNSRKI